MTTKKLHDGLNEALGYLEDEPEDHLRDCEGLGSSPLCEDYDCEAAVDPDRSARR